jgi:hypothetical protein
VLKASRADEIRKRHERGILESRVTHMGVRVHEAGANDALKFGIDPLFANFLDYSSLDT